MSWRGLGCAVVLAIAGLTSLPHPAEAQLFPNMWIRRQRVDRTVEPPFYSNVRQNYYGYYPTCWQKFPDGWACPCPNSEMPDLAAAFQKLPKDPKPKYEDFEEEGVAPGDEGGAGRGARPRSNNLPDLPGGTRSPFDLDAPPAGRPGNEPPAANPDLPAPSDGGRLRELPATPPRGTAPGTPPSGPTLPGAPAGRPGADPFSPGAGASRSTPNLPEISVNAPAPSTTRPLLDLPEFAGSPSAGSSTENLAAQPFPSSLPPNGNVTDNVPAAGTPAATTPKRTSVIGGLFGGLSRMRR